MSKRIKKPSREAVSYVAAFLAVEVEDLGKKIDNCLDVTWNANTQAKLDKLSEVSEWLKELYIEGRIK